VREEVRRALIMTRRLGGGVPLVAAADREEVIGYENSVMLRCTIFKNFMQIVRIDQAMIQKCKCRNSPTGASLRRKRHTPQIDSSVPVCLISGWRTPWSMIGTVSAHVEHR
jgi:hypothetical protein